MTCRIHAPRAEQHGEQRHDQRHGKSRVAIPGDVTRGEPGQRADAGRDRLVLQGDVGNGRGKGNHGDEHREGAALAEPRGDEVGDGTDLVRAPDVHQPLQERQREQEHE